MSEPYSLEIRRKESYCNDNANCKSNAINTSSSSSVSSSSKSRVDIPPSAPPDGGWGWVVVLASFFAHMIADGCGFTFGVLYTELLDYFNESKGKTALVGSLFVSVPLITAPLASACTNHFGCRITTIVGSMVAAVGFILSSFMPNIELLCITFGIIAGLGLSMVFVPAAVIVAYYFEKKRAFATGIAVSGSGVGTFIFAPLSEFLITTFGWRGAVLIIGGIILNIAICGAVFRPVEPARVSHKRKFLKSLNFFSEKCNSQRIVTDMNSVYDNQVSHYGTRPYTTDEQNKLLGHLSKPVTHSLVAFPTFHQKGEIKTVYKETSSPTDFTLDGKMPENLCRVVSTHILSELSENPGGALVTDCLPSHQRFQEELPLMKSEEALSITLPIMDNENVIILKKQCSVNSREERGIVNSNENNGSEIKILPNGNGEVEQERPPETGKFEIKISNGGKLNEGNQETIAEKKDISNEIKKEQKSSENDSAAPVHISGNLSKLSGMTSDLPRIKAYSCPNIFTSKASSNSAESLCPQECSYKIKHILHAKLNVSILRNIYFVIFVTSNMILYMWYDVPYVYTTDWAIDKGFSVNEASLLVSIIGIANMIGQLVIGYIGDRPCVDSSQLYNFLTTAAGIATMLVPLCNTYLALSSYSAAFGFFICGNYGLTTVILVDLLGMERLTSAYGILMLGQGIANLIGPPVAGWLSDITGSYDAAFIVAGAGIIISGLMLGLIPCLRYRQRKRHQNDTDRNNSGEEAPLYNERPGGVEVKDNTETHNHMIRTEPLRSGDEFVDEEQREVHCGYSDRSHQSRPLFGSGDFSGREKEGSQRETVI